MSTTQLDIPSGLKKFNHPRLERNHQRLWRKDFWFYENWFRLAAKQLCNGMTRNWYLHWPRKVPLESGQFLFYVRQTLKFLIFFLSSPHNLFCNGFSVLQIYLEYAIPFSHFSPTNPVLLHTHLYPLSVKPAWQRTLGCWQGELAQGFCR